MGCSLTASRGFPSCHRKPSPRGDFDPAGRFCASGSTAICTGDAEGSQEIPKGKPAAFRASKGIPFGKQQLIYGCYKSLALICMVNLPAFVCSSVCLPCPLSCPICLLFCLSLLYLGELRALSPWYLALAASLEIKLSVSVLGDGVLTAALATPVFERRLIGRNPSVFRATSAHPAGSVSRETIPGSACPSSHSAFSRILSLNR